MKNLNIQFIRKEFEKEGYLLISKELIHTLDTDEFYFNELIGMEVYSDDNLIGECIDIRDYPQGEVLVIKTSDREVLVPFRKEFVKEVNKEEKRIYLIIWEGLL